MGFEVSGVTVAAGQKNGQSDRKRNHEKRISNVEVQTSEFSLKKWL